MVTRLEDLANDEDMKLEDHEDEQNMIRERPTIEYF